MPTELVHLCFRLTGEQSIRSGWCWYLTQEGAEDPVCGPVLIHMRLPSAGRVRASRGNNEYVGYFHIWDDSDGYITATLEEVSVLQR